MYILLIAAFVFIALSMTIYLAKRYKRCPSDKILVVFGKVGKGQSARCMHGGGALVIPLFQDYMYMSLTPMTINIDLQNALSLQNIRINVPSTFTVGVSTIPEITNNAAERLLGLAPREIESMAREIIFGQLRLTVASLTIEQINQDRESFLSAIRSNVEPELNKIGLYLINVNITDITDESNYILSIGKKAAAEAINTAKVDVAVQEKLGSIGEAEATREKEIRVAENVAESIKGQKKAQAEQRVYVQHQEAEAVKGENLAEANIADYNAHLAVKQAEALRLGEVAKRVAEVEIQKAQYLAEQERLNAAEVVQVEINKRKIEIDAEAVAQRTRKEARGEADAVLMKYEAEAAGVQKVLSAKASGYQALVESCHGDAKAAATLLMVEKIEEIAQMQVAAIRSLKFDKITVWDSGSGAGKGTTSTADFARNLIKSLPPLHEVAKMAGVELPEYLGHLSAEGSDTTKAPSPTPPAAPVGPAPPVIR